VLSDNYLNMFGKILLTKFIITPRREDIVLMTDPLWMAWAEAEYKVNRIVSRYEYQHFFMVMVFLFVIQDQRFPNHVIIIRFVRCEEDRVKERGRKKEKGSLTKGLFYWASTSSHFSLKLYSAFDVNIKMYIMLVHIHSCCAGT